MVSLLVELKLCTIVFELQRFRSSGATPLCKKQEGDPRRKRQKKVPLVATPY